MSVGGGRWEYEPDQLGREICEARFCRGKRREGTVKVRRRK